jgi:hypothetical protein
MGVVGVNVEGKLESTALVHALWTPGIAIPVSTERHGRGGGQKRTLVRSDGQLEVEEIGRIGKVCLHCRREVELGEIWTRKPSQQLRLFIAQPFADSAG